MTSKFALVALLTIGLTVSVVAYAGQQSKPLGAQTSPTSKTAIVRVHVVGGLEYPEELPAAIVELTNRSGRTMKSESRTPFLGVPFGQYRIRVRYNGYLNTERQITVSHPNEFFVMGMLVSPAEVSSDFVWSLQRTGQVSPPPGGSELMWAKVIAVYGDAVQESPVDKEGMFKFVISPGRHILVIVQGSKVCDIRQLVAGTNPVEQIVLGKPCHLD